MTKEEILDNNCRARYGFDKSVENGRIYTRKDILKAMEQYAQQEQLTLKEAGGQNNESNCGGGIPYDSGSVLKDKDHYDALLDCCNGILDSVDAGKVPQRGIMGLKILLNR